MFKVKEKITVVKTKFKDVKKSVVNTIKTLKENVFTQQNMFLMILLVAFLIHPLLFIEFIFFYVLHYIWSSQFRVTIEE